MKKSKLIEILKSATPEQRARFRAANADKPFALGCLAEVEALEKRSPAPQPIAQPIAQPIEKAEDRFIKLASAGNANAARLADEQRVAKRAEAEGKLEHRLMEFADERGLDYRRQRLGVLAKGLEDDLKVRELYAAARYGDHTPGDSVPVVDIVGELAKSDVEPLQKRIDTLTTEREQRVADYAERHDLTIEKARAKLAVARSTAQAAGEHHWLDRWDREIEKCREQVDEARLAASQRVYELTTKAAEPDTAAERRYLEKLATEHPAERALRNLVLEFGKRNGIAAYPHALVRALDEDPIIKDLYVATRNLPHTAEMLEASAKLTQLEKRAG